MSFTLTLTFNDYEELTEYISEFNKYKNWKNKQENKKKNQTKEPIEETDDLIEILQTDVTDKRGLHQQYYHNQAKMYHHQHPELSYREALKHIYKNNKNNI
jgi:hypothetical protein